MQFETPHDAAHYLWDYFYIRHAPHDEEAKPWRRIECAAIRIRKSVSFIRPELPPAALVKHAKRIRRAAREIYRLVATELVSMPDPDVGAALGTVEGFAEYTIGKFAEAAEREPLH